MGKRAMDCDALNSEECTRVNPAGTGRKRHALSWEICDAVPCWTSRRATGGEGAQKSAEAVVAAPLVRGRRAESEGTRSSHAQLMDAQQQQNPERAGSPAAQGERDFPTGTLGVEERQAPAASGVGRALEQDLMEQVVAIDNLNQAFLKVKANKGAPGVDGMTVDQLREWVLIHKEALIGSLLSGDYRPQPVKGVQIPKPGGGVRQLGIPTVVDRLVQQAILQVLDPILDPTFSASSFGFRRGRGAHDALAQARQYVSEGRLIVVDLDLEKFFDRVNHDILMSRLARRIGDKRLLRIIRRFLEAGMMSEGVCVVREEGTPQGGPLSPLLANLLLDELDKELEKRGHCFCRYADDCNIYVQTRVAGERVMASVTQFLEGRLKLKVNREKSAVAFVEDRKFLGYRLLRGGKLGIAPKALERMKDKVRRITKRKRGIALRQMIEELNSFTMGWVVYYRHAAAKGHLRRLDEWIREKLRCFRLKQCKRAKAIADFLRRQGVVEWSAWEVALSGKGWWRLAHTPQAHGAMNLQWWKQAGLRSLLDRYLALQSDGNRRMR
jgi:RNA-directed DNA polymerase